jgi:hypothetical protein
MRFSGMFRPLFFPFRTSRAASLQVSLIRGAGPRTVKAPMKRFVWFEQSAHLPMTEEPGKFLLSLVHDVRPLAHEGARARSGLSERGRVPLLVQGNADESQVQQRAHQAFVSRAY